MSFRLKLFHRRREKVAPPNASNGALPSVSIAAEPSAEPNPQLQSLFLTLLPFDVRLMVYEHLLVVKPRLHVVDWQEAHVKLSHLECDEPENDSIRHRKCWNHLNGLSKMSKRAVITVGILQICRIVHSEAVDVLYRRNVFNLQTLSALTSFVALTPRPSHNLIHALNLHLFWYAWFPGSSVENLRQSTCPPAFKFEWKRACDVLIALEGLRELGVSIEFPRSNWKRAGKTERIWFEELRRVGREKALKRFDVEVNWPAGEGNEEDDFPFNLSRLRHGDGGY